MSVVSVRVLPSKYCQSPVYARAVKGEGQVNAQPVIALNVEEIDTGLDRAVLIRYAEAQHGGRLGAFHVQREVPDILDNCPATCPPARP